MPMCTVDRQSLDRISQTIIQAAIEIHRHLGPGLLERIYSECMIYELCERGLTVVTQQTVPVQYKKLKLDGAYRIDLLVENVIVVELKSVETLLPVHLAQMLTYLRLIEKRVGLVINFNVDYLVKGVRRIVNKF
jgi:GxxExxY protein